MFFIVEKYTVWYLVPHVPRRTYGGDQNKTIKQMKKTIGRENMEEEIKVN